MGPPSPERQISFSISKQSHKDKNSEYMSHNPIREVKDKFKPRHSIIQERITVRSTIDNDVSRNETTSSIQFHRQSNFSCPKLQYSRKRDRNWKTHIFDLIEKHKKSKKQIERNLRAYSSSQARLSPVKTINPELQFRAIYYKSQVDFFQSRAKVERPNYQTNMRSLLNLKNRNSVDHNINSSKFPTATLEKLSPKMRPPTSFNNSIMRIIK